MLSKGMGKDQEAGSKKDKNPQDKATKGARDEFEAVMLVVRDDKILQQKVLDRIRKHRELSQKSILDLGKAQLEAKETARRNRSQ